LPHWQARRLWSRIDRDPGRVLPGNENSATNLHGIFMFLGSER
jgi:hypothetical protein